MSMSLIYVVWLILSPFNQSPPPLTPLKTISLFLVSVPLVLFCSLVYFVHYIPLISEIIRYLSFTSERSTVVFLLSGNHCYRFYICPLGIFLMCLCDNWNHALSLLQLAFSHLTTWFLHPEMVGRLRFCVCTTPALLFTKAVTGGRLRIDFSNR